MKNHGQGGQGDRRAEGRGRYNLPRKMTPEKSGVESSPHHHISVLWIPGQDFTSQTVNIQSLPGRFVEKSVDVETFQSAAGPPTSSDVTMKRKIPGMGVIDRCIYQHLPRRPKL